MSVRPTERFEGPCEKCEYKTECLVYLDLAAHLFPRANFQRGEQLDAVDHLIIQATKQWLRHQGAQRPEGRPWTVRLAALFDLAASLLYAADLTESRHGEYTFVASGVSHESKVVFPYTWMCPLCIAARASRERAYLPDPRQERRPNRLARDYPIIERLAKPSSRAIGDAGFKILSAILRTFFVNSPMRICSGGGRRGEFDITLSDDRTIIFGEVKAKPLVCFPVIVESDSHSTEHAWVVPKVSECWLHVGAADLMVPLGRPTGDWWPMNQIVRIASDAGTVSAIERGWYRQLEAYRVWTQEPEELRWVRFGCGNFRAMENAIAVEKRVANTKELPGLDRTDDIKKGTAQLLLMSRLKFGCAKRALKSVLLGNTYAETHETDYLGPLSTMRVVDESGTRTEFIFDAILGLTRNIINDDLLGEEFRRASEPRSPSR